MKEYEFEIGEKEFKTKNKDEIGNLIFENGGAGKIMTIGIEYPDDHPRLPGKYTVHYIIVDLKGKSRWYNTKRPTKTMLKQFVEKTKERADEPSRFNRR